jgi:hypothetical protein
MRSLLNFYAKDNLSDHLGVTLVADIFIENLHGLAEKC